ncbi:putative nuclease HARBI1 isoform X1 [Solenopsis invicta]|nr:putative nuclease HARBI1 isoform X1 [Solenopsis invicta]XP_039304242.1 putative nuclease HARBI1 isoform X1 [Solenopsis invicta]XP_039304246.1 putative nuclease HARBI1 isoform X1 [Solenopsis invicta]XP_039304248.1 putative nuclease HARBI1 isoform X1 [Solenopsis invicta]XP_039304249.1 putative nuclease HARBI1 isoform X1 [Solenopsis invicta]XP_039304253.1 putative nuclease HARBI1 isoform X1 [Solenopsis invicta]
MRVVTALNEISSEIIFWPNSEQRQRITTSFQASAGIEGIVGAIDGTYIPIKAPSANPDVYINRKCFHALTLQVISDNNMLILDGFAGYPSRVSDIRIFRNSPIYEDFMNYPNNYFDDNQFIIGDKAYPVLQWCIPPYIERRNVTERQKHFNTCHAKSRQVIERCFALLFGRFRRLKYLDMNRTDFIAPTIIAACVLHNVCLNNPENQEIRDMFIDEGLQAVINNANNVNHVVANDNINIQELGIEGHVLRDRIAENLYPFQ